MSNANKHSNASNTKSSGKNQDASKLASQQQRTAAGKLKDAKSLDKKSSTDHTDKSSAGS